MTVPAAHAATAIPVADPAMIEPLAPDLPEAPLTRRMGKAALWSGLNAFVLRAGQFLIGVVVARVIAPEQFGVFAVALTVQAVIVNVSELGVSAALVRAKENVDAVARVVALISVVSSALLAAAMFVAAPYLSAALGAASAANAVRILSTTVLIGGLTAVPYAMLVREFRQDKRFLADGANFAVSSAAVIGLGLAGFGATALATSRVMGGLASMIILFVIITPRYRPGWDRVQAKAVLKYSLPLAGADVVAFSLSNVDYVVVGRLKGALPLGYYNLAYNISGWPVSVLGLIINEVAMPAFAHGPKNRATLPRRTAGAITLTASLALPISALILALAHPLVVTVYGHRWAGAATALGILGLFGSTRILITLITNILAALGHSRAILWVQLVWLASLVPALIVGVSARSIAGAALAQEVVSIGIVLPLALVLLSRAGGGPVSRLAAALGYPIVVGAAAGVTAYLVSDLFDIDPVRVVVGGLAGTAMAAALLYRPTRRLVGEARQQWNDDDATDDDATDDTDATDHDPAVPVAHPGEVRATGAHRLARVSPTASESAPTTAGDTEPAAKEHTDE